MKVQHGKLKAGAQFRANGRIWRCIYPGGTSKRDDGRVGRFAPKTLVEVEDLAGRVRHLLESGNVEIVWISENNGEVRVCCKERRLI